MKVGIIISSAIVLVIGALLIVAMLGSPDKPSRLTADPAVLQIHTLPNNLPQVATVKGNAGNAEDLYDQAIAYYQQEIQKFSGEGTPPVEQGDHMAGLLIRAMEAGDVSRPFLDKYLGMKISPRQSKFGNALSDIPVAMQRYAQDLWENDEKARAIEISRAVWTLGRRAHEKCIRLINRFQGLQAMTLAGTDLYNWSGEGTPLAAQIDPWIPPINDLQQAWKTKLEIVLAIRWERLGDLMNIAMHDQDLSFRVEATLRLGLARWSPKTSANLRYIEKYLKNTMNSENKALADAATAAMQMTAEDVRNVY